MDILWLQPFIHRSASVLLDILNDQGIVLVKGFIERTCICDRHMLQIVLLPRDSLLHPLIGIHHIVIMLLEYIRPVALELISDAA